MAPPANWTTVQVEGTYIYPDGVAAAGTVTFTASLYLRDADLNYVVVPKPVQVTLDGSGHFATTLQATDDPDIDPTFFYTVTEVVGGQTTTFPLLVPKDTPGVLQLADVDRNQTIPEPPEIYVRTINGQYGDVEVAGGGGGGTPASTVVDETTFGISPAVGTSVLYARGDHTHGSPTLGTTAPSAISITASGAAGSSNSAAHHDHTHAGPGFGTPVAVTIGGSNGAGSAATPARSDHVHGGPGFGNVTAQTTAGLSSANGAATTVARADHSHGTPANPTPSDIGAVPTSRTITAGTGLTGGGDLSANRTLAVVADTTQQRVNVMKAGSAIGLRQEINLIEGSNVTMTVADDAINNRVNITINSAGGGGGGTPAGSVTSETTFGISSAVGSSTNYAREDHTHGTPSGFEVRKNGASIGTRPIVNFIEGTNVTLTVADDAGNNRVNVTVTASGGGGGGTPATTVVSETAYGQSTAVGSATTYAREDHSHGSPSLSSATPAAVSITAAGAAGSGTTPSRNDHQHAGPGFGSVVSETSYGQSAANGTAGTVPHSDHTHGTPALPTPSDIGAPPNSRLVSTSTGLTGGGDLSADRTLSVVADSTVQQSRYSKGGTLQGTRRELNLIEGSNVTLTVADDVANNRVNVTVAATGAGVPSTGGTFTGDLTVNDTITVKPSGTGVRGVRVDATSADRIDFSVDDLYFYGTATADFGGTLLANIALKAAGGQFIFGQTQWYTAVLGTLRHIIDGGSSGSIVFNEDGASTDFRVEGDTDQNTLFVKGSTDRVGIGVASPTVKLDVNGESKVTAASLTGINSLSTARYAGRKTTVGAPTSSTWAAGDVVIDAMGVHWLCTSAGTPGTWVSYGAGVVALTAGTTVNTDCSLGNYFRWTAAQNFTLANPTNPQDGMAYTWEIIQDGTGSRVATYGSQFAFGTDIPNGTLTTTASKRDFLRTIYNATATKHYVVGFSRGY